MKKTISLILAILMFALVFTGCDILNFNDNSGESESESEDSSEKVIETDIWDGSIATSFAGGDGSETSPYEISTGAQLAFFAKQVNDGKINQGKCFVLTNNIDLNNIEWTPIGTYENMFSGSFNGNGYTIKNIKITDVIHFFKEIVELEITNDYCVSGFFGICRDVHIRNLTLNSLSVNMPNEKSDYAYMGGLIGFISNSSKCSIQNIRINDASLETIGLTPQSYLRAVGGLAGMIAMNVGSSICTIDNVSVNVSCDNVDGYGSINHAGSMIGAFTASGTVTISNLDGDFDYSLPNYHEPTAVESSVGMFGIIQYNGTDRLVISNIFSDIAVICNHNNIGTSNIYLNSVIGEVYHVKNSNGKAGGEYIFDNVFGKVQKIGDSLIFERVECKLYSMPSHSKYSEQNCAMVESLPENHGFDSEIWDLSDLSKPKLK